MTVLGKRTIANCTAIFKQLQYFAASVCGPWHGNILHWRCENTGSTTALWYGHECFKQTRWHLCKNNEDSMHNSTTSASSSDQFDVIHCAGMYHVQGILCYLKRRHESSKTIFEQEIFLALFFPRIEEVKKKEVGDFDCLQFYHLCHITSFYCINCGYVWTLSNDIAPHN